MQERTHQALLVIAVLNLSTCIYPQHRDIHSVLPVDHFDLDPALTSLPLLESVLLLTSLQPSQSHNDPIRTNRAQAKDTDLNVGLSPPIDRAGSPAIFFRILDPQLASLSAASRIRLSR